MMSTMPETFAALCFALSLDARAYHKQWMIHKAWIRTNLYPNLPPRRVGSRPALLPSASVLVGEKVERVMLPPLSAIEGITLLLFMHAVRQGVSIGVNARRVARTIYNGRRDLA